MGDPTAGRFCDCPDAPVRVNGPATLLDHAGGCEFPDGVCSVREHRITIHDRCGLPVPVRFCACGSTAFTLDLARNWWVCWRCGWPTRAWYEAAGAPAPDDLAGLRPVTYHDYEPVTGSANDLLRRFGGDPERVALNRRLAGQPVRD